MCRLLLLCVILSFSLFSNPVGLETLQGTVSLHEEKENLHIHASHGAVLNWKDFSIGANESTQFFQPREHSWVLNRVIGEHSSEILGTLLANGQVVLLNPQGILFGKGAIVDVGGIIASTLNEGTIVNKGLIRARSGDIILMGRKVECFGKIETIGSPHAAAADNPYELAINFVKPKEATEIRGVNGRIILTSEEHTFVSNEGTLVAKEIALLSKGITAFQGHADVDNGYIEISGSKGFDHRGKIDRKGGHLILDPESDITISSTVPYNYSFEEGGPTADLSNIFIDFLLDEINKGPVTITTSYQGDGGSAGSILIKENVAHTYNSPYPLIFNCSGSGGITVAGKLRNLGNGEIMLNSKEITIFGEVDAATIETQGHLTCSGGLYGQTIKVHSESGGLVTGKIVAEGGPLTWFGGGTLALREGEIGSEGKEALTIQGLENISLEAGSRLFTFSSNLSIIDLTGALSIEDSTIFSGGPLNISGGQGALHLNQGTIHSNSSLSINLGRHLHCHNSFLQAEQPITLMLESDLILTENSLLTSTKGISLNNKGALLMDNHSMIKGQGLL